MYNVKHFKESALVFDFLPPLQEAPSHGAHGNMPIEPMAASTWETSHDPNGKKLKRLFEFQNVISRNIFVDNILELEEISGHNIDFSVYDSNVLVHLQTKDLGIITELDLECGQALVDYAYDIHQAGLDT
jgi:pterin-4a-carbinolamine dehydratase